MSSKNTKNKSGKNNESEVVSTDNSSTTKKEDTPTPVHLYDGGAVKLLLDDAIKNIITKHNYVEKFTLIDTRIAMSASAIALALVALVYGFVTPFPGNSLLVGLCVIGYFLLMGGLTLFTFYYEKDIIMLASKKFPTTSTLTSLVISTQLPRFDDKFTISIKATNSLLLKKSSKSPSSSSSSSSSSSTEKTINVQLTQSISKWFYSNGYLAEDVFEKDVEDLLQSALEKLKD